MFYDPTPPLSSSWSEWPGRLNMPGHYDEEDWGRPLGGQNRSFSNPRLRRFDFMEDNPRMSRTNSRTDSSAEMNSEGDDSPEQETGSRPPPRVHRIPIFVEERQSSQESTDSPDTPGSAEEIRKEWEASHGNNTVPRFRRRNYGSEDDLHRSQSHTSAFQRARARDTGEPQPQPRRRRQNVTTVKVNCDEDAELQQQQQQQQQPVDPKREQLSVIESVVKEVDELKKQVERVSGKEDKHVRYLDEMLTRCMLKLDNVNTMGEEDVRLARKSAICNVQSCIDLLESKLHPPPPPERGDMKSPQVTDKQVIVLPFYNNGSDGKEVTSSPEADVGNGQNGAGKTDKNVIVLPYNRSKAEEPKSTEKAVIVLPYHDVTENREKKDTQANATSPEKTVIVLPYREKSTDKADNGVIALPYYETAHVNDSRDDENMCTKL